MAELIDPQKISEADQKMFHSYGKVNEAKKKFINLTKPSTFQFLFGGEEGIRLWRHFVVDCNRDYNKFETYLIKEQYNTLLVNITLNEDLYAQ